jgi:hypothetical protein
MYFRMIPRPLLHTFWPPLTHPWDHSVLARQHGIAKTPDFRRFAPKALRLHTDEQDEGTLMMVATGLAIFVVICLLLSMVQTPPAIGK